MSQIHLLTALSECKITLVNINCILHTLMFLIVFEDFDILMSKKESSVCFLLGSFDEQLVLNVFFDIDEYYLIKVLSSLICYDLFKS